MDPRPGAVNEKVWSTDRCRSGEASIFHLKNVYLITMEGDDFIVINIDDFFCMWQDRWDVRGQKILLAAAAQDEGTSLSGCNDPSSILKTDNAYGIGTFDDL